jgi:hypothetical protein
MHENTASRIALRVAARRAAHQVWITHWFSRTRWRSARI